MWQSVIDRLVVFLALPLSLICPLCNRGWSMDGAGRVHFSFWGDVSARGVLKRDAVSGWGRKEIWTSFCYYFTSDVSLWNLKHVFHVRKMKTCSITEKFKMNRRNVEIWCLLRKCCELLHRWNFQDSSVNGAPWSHPL